MTSSRRLLSPLGCIHVFVRNGKLAGVYFSDQRGCPKLQTEDPCSLSEQVADWLQNYFQGVMKPIHFEFDFSSGTELQRAVWNALLTIQPGKTCSYGQIAKAVGRPSAVRAVANAIGKNPVSIIIPCHRVIGSDGRLTGYAGGLDRKAWLLQHERD